MRTFTSKVDDGLLGRRDCLLLVIVFVCSVDCSNASGASTRDTTNPILFRNPGDLTDNQRRSIVTIEFNWTNVNPGNKTAVDIAHREVRRKLVEYLNRRRSTTTTPNTTTAPTTLPPSSPTPTSTAITTTSTTPTTTVITTTLTTTSAAPTTIPTTSVVETTTETQTTAATTTMTTQQVTTTLSSSTMSTRRTIPPNRRRRSSDETNVTYTEEDLQFILIQPVINENGILRISLFLDTKGSDDLLNGVKTALNSFGKLNERADAPIWNIYRGLPGPETSHLNLYFLIPVFMTFSMLLVIFIFVFHWKARNKKMAVKTVPTV